MPRRLIIEMVYAANYWLNMFPRQGGVSKTLSPRALLTGKTWSYTTHCKLEFGDYVQTHEEHDNSMAARTIGAIALRPTGNTQGGYFFYSLTSGRVLNRGRWTSLPMPNEVIDRVHRMACQEHGNNGLFFEDRNHNPLVDPDDADEDDSTYHPEEGDDDIDDGDDNEDGDDDDDDPDLPQDPNDEQPLHTIPPHINNDDPADEADQESESDHHDDNDEERTIKREQSTSNMEERAPNNQENDERTTSNDTGTPTIPNDPDATPTGATGVNPTGQ